MKTLLARFKKNAVSCFSTTSMGKREMTEELMNAWKECNIPQRQFEQCVEKELEAYRKGHPLGVYDTLVEIIKSNIVVEKNTSLLEVGCSSGYYNEVLRLRGIDLSYTGCDFSEAFIEFAKKLYPHCSFHLEDATKLSYKDNSFDIVVSGCCLLHILAYEQAIAEAARVAKNTVIFHRTPLLLKKETRQFVKTAYGVEMFEIHFSERELIRLFAHHGLVLKDVITISSHFEPMSQDVESVRTYLCEKNKKGLHHEV